MVKRDDDAYEMFSIHSSDKMCEDGGGPLKW